MAAVRQALNDTADSADRPPQAASIAVLPFTNLSADKENEYFSDGLAEEILNALGGVPGLRVIARSSAFAFKGRQEDVRNIGKALSVGHILEGSVRKAGNRIRVTAQLVEVRSASQVWSERYDRQLDDVFAIQDEIAQAIVDTLKVRLTNIGRPLVKRYTSNLEAHSLYLRGTFHL
jgi:TolB-like protein